MPNFIILLLFFTILVMTGPFIIILLSKDVSDVKVMLLGLAVIMVGGIIAIDINVNFIGYTTILIGLIFTMIGFFKKSKSNDNVEDKLNK